MDIFYLAFGFLFFCFSWGFVKLASLLMEDRS